MVNHVVISAKAKKEITKLPGFIVTKLLAWVDDVKFRGLEMVRKIPGYHDEPLKGDRKGQRSIRLNKAYRAIYIIKHDGTIEFVEVIEVNKHEY
jgi:proteic killer suppression protein